MPLTLRIRKGVASDVRSAMHGFSRFVRSEIWVPHQLEVNVDASASVYFGSQAAAGWFIATNPDPQILLAGNIPNLVENYGGNRALALASVLDNFAHEVAHYEQYRDGRDLLEHGRAVRARNIVKQYLNWRADRGQ